jgi:hypothetical protein
LIPKHFVLAGSGPLLLLLAQQYRAAGVTINALLDTTPKSNYWYSMPWLVAGLTTPRQLFKGVWLTLLQRIKLPYISGISHIEIVGNSQVSGVRYTVAGKVHHLSCNLVMLHQGLIPQTQMAQLLGCHLEWNDPKQCWQAQVSAGTITAIEDTGCAGVNQLKSLPGQVWELVRGGSVGLI